MSKPKTARLGKVERTSRGFEIVNFQDAYGHPCSLQASSLAVHTKPGTSAVWLGCNDAAPKVMASRAHMRGIQTKETDGWIPFPVPKDVLLTTRMHLNRKQVTSLIAHLQNWLDADTFSLRNVH